MKDLSANYSIDALHGEIQQKLWGALYLIDEKDIRAKTVIQQVIQLLENNCTQNFNNNDRKDKITIKDKSKIWWDCLPTSKKRKFLEKHGNDIRDR